MKLLISLASRGRPALLVDTLHKTLDNIARPDTKILVALDEDDPPSCEAVKKELTSQPLPGRILMSVRPREDTIAEKWNRALEWDADLYMPMVDHTVPTTRAFDHMIVQAAEHMYDQFNDNICAVHIHMSNLSFAAYNALSNGWVQRLGQIYPTYFPFWFVDHWTDDLARMINRIAYADVAFNNARKPMTQEMREPGWWATWYDAAWPLRMKQANKLLENMRVTEGYKNNLRTGWDRVFMRSARINYNVRRMDQGLSQAGGNLSLKDPRYLRVKQKALAMVDDLLADFPPVSSVPGLQAKKPADYLRAILKPPTTITNLPNLGAA
jgi:hypothetical protein